MKNIDSRLLQGFNLDNQTLIKDWRISNEESIRLIREEMDRRLEEMMSFTNIIHEKIPRKKDRTL